MRLARCGTFIAVSMVCGAAVPAAVGRWGLCPRCPGVGRSLSGYTYHRVKPIHIYVYSYLAEAVRTASVNYTHTHVYRHVCIIVLSRSRANRLELARDMRKIIHLKIPLE